MNSMKLSFALLTLCTLITLGCGKGSDGRLTASGTVTIDGAPLTEGSVVFSDDNGGSAGVGILKDGQFMLAEAGNSEGIQPGTYKVSVNSWVVEPGGVDANDEIIEDGESRIPEKYNDPNTSGLTANVSADSQEFTFDLKSE